MGADEGQTGDTGDTGQGDGGDAKWYDGASEEAMPTLKKYEALNDFISAHMSLQSKLGGLDNMITPVDANAEADVQQVQLRAARIKLGAKATPEEYQINIPPEVASQIPEELIQKARENACRAGLTQAEVDVEVTQAVEQYQEEQEILGEVNRNLSQERDTIKGNMDRALDAVWGDRKSTFIKLGDDMCDYWDRVLFRQENEQIPAEERSEKGGIIHQIFAKLDTMKIEGIPYSVGAAMRRIGAMSHDRILGEGVMHRGEQQGEKASAFAKLFEQAKADYPLRGERYWKELATAQAKRLGR